MSVYILNAIRFYSPIPNVGTGDGDVCTKSGRATDISIETGEPQFSSDNRFVEIPFSYGIQEVKNLDTTLRLDTTIRIPIPVSLRKKKLEIDNIKTLPYSYNNRIVGENHRYNTIPYRPDTCVIGGFFRFDGSGADDKGNAAIKLYLRIPIIIDEN